MESSSRIFIQRGDNRIPTSSLAPHLHLSLAAGQTMDPKRMDARTRRGCRWLGYGIGKGVTHPTHGVSVFAIPSELVSGLHGELIQGFPNIAVDPTPACYEASAVHGFGGFVRWVLFADPHRKQDILGIDFSLILGEEAGIATTTLSCLDTVRVLREHGINEDTEIVLLNASMREPATLSRWRQRTGLVRLGDWLKKGPQLFHHKGEHCPRCGLHTLKDPSALYCFRCGAKPSLIWSHHTETHHASERS